MGHVVSPSRPAWRVISAITSFGPQLPWGLLETGQEGGLLPLRAPILVSIDRRTMLLR
ncbi:Hypothetical protein DHA2_154492 [Giardia duodenalis]|uniref:Uncharacterized protein n=1 Tax=Giardia intestinalis TaxID=5741 RepID=V6TF47_GIAIN|nr:Hypothetical protein DHA2_154492 [Giardia intestinalis]